MNDRTGGGGNAGARSWHEGSPCWVVLVTRGLSAAFPPEIYTDRAAAEREAERWALALADGAPVRRPFPGRWEVDEVWVRLVPARRATAHGQLWVGTHWTPDGYPEPEAVVFAGRAEAHRWASSPPVGGRGVRLHETPWTVMASFAVRGGEADTEVHLAKVVI